MSISQELIFRDVQQVSLILLGVTQGSGYSLLLLVLPYQSDCGVTATIPHAKKTISNKKEICRTSIFSDA
jgi:hypothetical protein